MPLTRRQMLAGMAAAAARARAQSRPRQVSTRATSALCLYSQVLVKVDYNDLGPILRGLGFDGCDLSVQRGGHVAPEKATLDLMPALEAMTGAGLEVPMITTSFTSAADPLARNVLFLAGVVQVPLFIPGHWHLGGALDLLGSGMVQRDLIGLASIAGGYGLATAIPNFVDAQGSGTVEGFNPLLRGIDPKWVGWDFDIGYATAQAGEEGWQAAFQMAMPRLKAVTLRDFTWTKEAGSDRKMTPCPLGQGVVDWPHFFAMLAGAKFTGPITLHTDYRPKEELPAIRQDVQFVKKQIASAYRG